MEGFFLRPCDTSTRAELDLAHFSRILHVPMSTAAKPKPQLARDLGVSHATAIVVGTIIGSGIFLVPSEMMQAVGSASPGSWVACSRSSERSATPNWAR